MNLNLNSNYSVCRISAYKSNADIRRTEWFEFNFKFTIRSWQQLSAPAPNQTEWHRSYDFSQKWKQVPQQDDSSESNGFLKKTHTTRLFLRIQWISQKKHVLKKNLFFSLNFTFFSLFAKKTPQVAPEGPEKRRRSAGEAPEKRRRSAGEAPEGARRGSAPIPEKSSDFFWKRKKNRKSMTKNK